MPRLPRVDVAGEIYHVINRSNGRAWLFDTDGDYRAVLDALAETLEKVPIEIFAFCIMSNHWHFAARPMSDGDMGRFFGKFTQKLTQRWHKFHRSVGTGHLFQGRYKSFLVQTDEYFLQLMKYIEANPLRAGLVANAEEWRWGSLGMRIFAPRSASEILVPWPVEMPINYLEEVNRPIPKAFIEQIRGSVVRGRPLGNETWVAGKVGQYGLECTIREPHRPRTAK